MAIVGLVLAVIFPLVGLIVSIIALKQTRKTGQGGHGLALAGIIVSAALMLMVVLGVLFAFVLMNSSGIQGKSRDTQRKTDIIALQSHVETYYAENGHYPTYAQLNDSSWRDTNMKGLDPEALTDPDGNSIGSIAATAGPKTYGYVPTHDDGSLCAATGIANDDNCTKYTLIAVLESPQTDGSLIYTKSSEDLANPSIEKVDSSTTD
jgi:peptidyl-prolyl cis-trans isomerase B (cyclophilin B)